MSPKQEKRPEREALTASSCATPPSRCFSVLSAIGCSCGFDHREGKRYVAAPPCLACGRSCTRRRRPGGCGKKSDEDQIESVVKQFSSGIADGDGEKACNALAGPYQRGILSDVSSGTCAERISEFSDTQGSEEKDSFRKVEVTEVELHGSTALARTISPKPNSDFDNDAAYNMKKFGDEWKIASNNGIEAGG